MYEKCDYVAYDENPRNDLGAYQAISTATSGKRPDESSIHDIIERKECSGGYDDEDLVEDKHAKASCVNGGRVAKEKAD